MKLITTTMVLALAAGTAFAGEFATRTHGAVTGNGDIHVPDADFRQSWPVLGSWTVLGQEDSDGLMAGGGMHVVYTQPGVIETYLETGSFPDGAVLVKELFSIETDVMTTGTVARAHEVEGWFVMVKDTKGRFEGNPLWGDGWGWAFFGADDRETTTSVSYQDDCLACHVPAQETDWVYTQGYPVLKD